MALDPEPGDIMLLLCRIQALPQLSILNRLFVGGFPAVALPAIDPFADPVFDIDAVGREFDIAPLLQRFKRADRRHQFHLVVGGDRLAAPEFFAMEPRNKNGTPPAWPWVARARTVRENRNLGQR